MAHDRLSPLMPTRHVALQIQQNNRIVAAAFGELPDWLFNPFRSTGLPARGSTGGLAMHIFHRLPLQATSGSKPKTGAVSGYSGDIEAFDWMVKAANAGSRPGKSDSCLQG